MFLGRLAGAAGGLALWKSRGYAAEPPAPKEGGLASEGLLAGQPGFHPRSAAPLPYEEIPGFLSHTQLVSHYAEYLQAVAALRAAEQALTRAPRTAAALRDYAALRHEQVASANAVLLHDFYFSGLSIGKVDVPTYVRRHMTEHMGPLESWAADFTACALAAKAWAVLAYDPYDDRWHNTVMDSDMDGVWIGANPLVVCDTAIHAYSADFERREDYVAKFLEHIDWETVAKRYRRVDRM
jgi:Fe-Mn family superoxide dismutase